MTNPDFRRVHCRVNLNGSSAASLVALWCEVEHKANELSEALGKACPHGRDYQTIGDTDGDAYTRDRAMYETMQIFVRNVREYAENSAIYIDEQGARR